MAKAERRRVSREDVKANANMSGKGGSSTWFTLPEGVQTWEPDEPGTFMIDILPYEVAVDDHPDVATNITRGTVWYKFPFLIHKNIGAGNLSLVCPRTKNRKCPICEEKDALVKKYGRSQEEYKAHEDEIKAVKPQGWMAMNIKDPNNPDGVALFAMSSGKFWAADAGLEKEIKEATDLDNNFFYEVSGEGRTLKCRFSEAEYNKQKFLKCTKIEFVERDPLDEDEVLSKTVCLDNVFNIMEYDSIKALFLQLDEADTPEAQAEPAKKQEPKNRSASASGAGSGATTTTKEKDKKTKEIGYVVGERVKWHDKGIDEDLEGKILVVDEDGDIEVQDDQGETYDIKADDILGKVVAKEEPKQATKTKAKDKDKDKDEEITWAKGDDVTLKDGSTVKVLDIDEDGDVSIKKADGKTSIIDKANIVGKAGGKPKADKSKKAELKLGQWVTDGESEGEVITIDEEDITVKGKDGMRVILDLKKLTVKAKPLVLAPGDPVSWDDGDETGEVLRVEADRVKVKGKDGDKKWVPIAEVKKA